MGTYAVIRRNGEYEKTTDGYLLLTTGKFGSVVTEGSPKNIYDIAGNAWEWIAETVMTQGGSTTSIGNKVLRGGSYSSGGTTQVASYRVGNVANTAVTANYGFRFVLYVK